MPNYGHHRSDRIFAVLQPTSGIRDEMVRRGVKPHNHARDNVINLRAMQKLNRERREAAAAAAATPRQAKYPAVESRVAAQLARPLAPSQVPKKPVEPRNFQCPKPSGPAGRAFTAWAPPPLLEHRDIVPAGALGSGRRERRKPVVDHRPAPLPKPPAVDFVKRNAELSALTPRKAAAVEAAAEAASPPRSIEKSRYYGRVPPYLLDRKLEAARTSEAAAAAARPRECPVGTHVLEESERVRVLGLVQKGQTAAHAALDAMPFVVDTYGLRAKHEALTRQLQALDAAEKAFSRRKVIVSDSPPAPAVDGADSSAGVDDHANLAESPAVAEGAVDLTDALADAASLPRAVHAAEEGEELQVVDL